MDPSTILSILSTAALFCGVVFAGIQVRNAQRQRTHDTALQFMQTVLSAEFMRALRAILSLPDGLSKHQVEERTGAQADDLFFFLATCESLGILVHRGDLSLDLVDDMLPLQSSWRKLSKYVVEARNELGVVGLYEWFQWLAEQMQGLEPRHPPKPANVNHRGSD
jgi:hypothetical protein